MGLEIKVVQPCKLCGGEFERSRRQLDSLGSDVLNQYVCPTCIKGLEKENEYIEVKHDLDKQPKSKPKKVTAKAGGGLIGKEGKKK